MNTIDKIKSPRRIAFVASDSKKTELIHWLYFNRRLFAGHELVATGTQLANILSGTLNVPVETKMDALFGGDHQLIRLMEDGELDAIIFFGDNMHPDEYQNDVTALQRTAVKNNLIIACNTITASIVLESLKIRAEELFAEAV